MAQQFSRIQLSASPNGSGISASTSVANVHAAGGSKDEIWLYAANQGSTTQSVQIYWAAPNSSSTAAGKIESTLAAASGLTLIIPGLILDSGLYVNCTASTVAGSIVIYGFVNRISNV